MENQKVHNKNFRLWKYCQKTRQLCMDAGFLSEMCSLFPYQAVNLVRLRLKLSETFLVDEQLDVRVLHLVRDPRAVIHSRINDESNLRCSESVACHDPAKLCSDMVDDFYAAEELREKYPDTFLYVQYFRNYYIIFSVLFTICFLNQGSSLWRYFQPTWSRVWSHFASFSLAVASQRSTILKHKCCKGFKKSDS